MSTALAWTLRHGQHFPGAKKAVSNQGRKGLQGILSKNTNVLEIMYEKKFSCFWRSLIIVSSRIFRTANWHVLYTSKSIEIIK
jgi:hypothetical protein